MSIDSYSGVRRRKQTPWRVKFGDALVSRLITIGGIGTIGAVLLVVLVLFSTAWPLHRFPKFSDWSKTSIAAQSVLHAGCDEHGLSVWFIDRTGELHWLASHDGKEIRKFESPQTDDRKISCSALSIDRKHLTLGFTDGTFQAATIDFESRLLAPEEVPAELQLNSEQPIVMHEQSLYQWLGETGVRRVNIIAPTWSKPEKIADAPLVAIDRVEPEAGGQFSQQASSTCVAATQKELIVAQIEAKENMLTGEVSQEVTHTSCPLERRSVKDPIGLMLMNRATQIVIAWDIGTLDRFSIDAQGPNSMGPHPMESVSGLPGGGKFTAAAPLIARQTFLLGDEAGVLHGWNVIQSNSTDIATDGYRLMETHTVQLGGKALSSIESSSGNHLALVADADSRLCLVMTTTDSFLKQEKADTAEPIKQTFLMPKNDGVFVLSDSELSHAVLDVAYPEASFRSLFGKVWYEGHAEPKYIWQSSAGTEQSEPKLSLIPLIFGTLKATVYAMIVSVPLAIFSAIYTSEFLSASLRTRIKPIIELMASLPSVILGFIAALVLAPLLQQNLTSVLLSLFLVPATFCYAAHLWNLLPLELIVRLQSWRLVFILLCIPIGLLAAFALGPAVERWLFSANIVQWMSGNIGSAVGGWMLLLVPLVTCVAVFVMLGPLAQWNRHHAINMSPRSFAIRGLLQLMIVTVLIVSGAWLLSFGLDLAGLDARKSLFVGYQERNSLLVGAVLGFCVIPLIYTLADDALQSVPQSLRSASLGCGATPWQTTMRVVVPSAMSGMFSAIMIGFGRAVGETMVVLMAAGNTPIMEWNPFNGFRTLSATLATELPEAAKGSTHFRTLFLAALLLFAMTLIANTIAEFVRIRFRRRGSQL